MSIPEPQAVGQGLTQAFISQIRQKLQPTFDGLYAGKTPTGTSLPTIAKDGQTLRVKLLATATGALVDVTWILTYDAASAYWIPVGAPLMAEVDTSESTASTTFAALTTPGPKITLPFAGDYKIEIGCASSNNTATVESIMSYSVGATAASGADAVVTDAPTTGTVFASVARSRRKTVLAGDAVTCLYETTVGGTASFQNRWLNITPLRVH